MPILRRVWKITKTSILAVISIIIFLVVSVFATLLIPGTPSNSREWLPEQAVQASAEFNGTFVHLKNIRNTNWRTPTDYEVRYYDKTYDLSKVRHVYFIYTPFSNIKPLAHTFVSYEFENGEHLSVSVEVRKEKNESYSALNGLLKKYEIFYVISDERDSLGYRAIAWKNPLFIYPVKTTPERARKALVSMLTRGNDLREKPEFYHTFFNNCTTNLVRHVNEVVPSRIPFISLGVIFPGYADVLSYRLGLIDTELSLEEAQKLFYANDRIIRYINDSEFSAKIRSNK